MAWQWHKHSQCHAFLIEEAGDIASTYRTLAEKLPKGESAYELLCFIAKRLEQQDSVRLTPWRGLDPPEYSVDS